MSERDNILARIREALTLSAPRPGSHGPHTGTGSAGASPYQAGLDAAPIGAGQRLPPFSIQPLAFSLPPSSPRQWLPPVGPDFDDHVKLFQACSLDLKTDFHLLPDLEALPAFVAHLAAAEGWKKAAIHSGSLTDLAGPALGLPLLHTDHGYDVHEMESCDVGVTECDALIAQTGSVLLTSRSAGGRALSVLPPHHLVLARRAQLLPDLPAAFQLLAEKYGANLPSFITFATGPSRTGDIERILVLGAHGPKKLTIVCG